MDFNPGSATLFSFEEETDAWYYFNFNTGETQWTHPLDSVFQKRVAAERGDQKKTETEGEKEMWPERDKRDSDI